MNQVINQRVRHSRLVGITRFPASAEIDEVRLMAIELEELRRATQTVEFRPTVAEIRAYREENEVGLFEARRTLIKINILKELDRPNADLRQVLITMLEHIIK